MSGLLSVEKQGNGQRQCVFTVQRREEVNALTLDLIEAGFDVLYEPMNRGTGYESCIICGEEAYLRIVTAR